MAQNDDVQDAIERARENSIKLGDTVKSIAENFTKPLDLLIDKFNEMGSSGSGAGKLLAGAFAAVGIAITQATESSKEFIRTLGQIKGINGNVGQLAQAITAAATGSVSKQDIADFLAATSDLFANAQAQMNQLGLIQNLIAAYGDVTVAASKFRDILMLSEESQKAIVSAIEKQAQLMENTPEAKLEAQAEALEEIAVTIGTDLMTILEPLLALISSLADAMRTLSDITVSDGTRAEAIQEEIELTEEEKKALEELNAIELGGYTSSLDEVHTSEGALIDEEAESTGLGINSAAVDEVDNSFQELKETFTELTSVLTDIWDIFSTIAASIGPVILDIIGWVADLVGGFLEWLDSIGLLRPALTALLGVVMGIAAIKFANWVQQGISALISMIAPTTAATAAQASLATASLAAAGASTYGIAVPIILAAIAAGVAGLAALGVFSSGGSSGSTSSYTPSNSYGGTSAETSAPQVTIYMDGKKVSDGLANSNYYDSEVKVG